MLKKLAEYLDLSVKTVIIGGVALAAVFILMVFFGIDPSQTIGFND